MEASGERSVLQDMELLRSQALRCTDCPLSLTRTQVVFGEGNPETPLMLVGEGPGEMEDRLGRPFVGRAGQLLDECLAAVKISRRHVWITNILKCRASVTDERGRVQNRPPTPAEIASCRQWIEAEIALIRPLVLVCVGGPAANTLIHPRFQIMKERGVWFTKTPYAPFAMAVLHPAFILRQHGEAFERYRALLIEDLEAARQKVVEAKRLLREGSLLWPPKPSPPEVPTPSLFEE